MDNPKPAKRLAVKRKRRRKPNTVEENLMAAQAIATALLTAYNIVAPIVRNMKRKRDAQRRAKKVE